RCGGVILVCPRGVIDGNEGGRALRAFCLRCPEGYSPGKDTASRHNFRKPQGTKPKGGANLRVARNGGNPQRDRCRCPSPTVWSIHGEFSLASGKHPGAWYYFLSDSWAHSGSYDGRHGRRRHRTALASTTRLGGHRRL